MNDIKSIVISIIFCIFTISLCELLVPKNSYKNQMRLITGAILLITMLSPFLNGVSFNDFDIKENSYDINRITEKSVALGYKTKIFEVLKKKEIENAKISINTEIDQNNSIKVNDIIILFDIKDKFKVKSIKNTLDKKLKMNVQTRIDE